MNTHPRTDIASQALLKAAICLALAAPATAQNGDTDATQTEAATTTPEADTADATTQGVLPVPEYGGDFADRAFALGDLDGARTDLAEKGIQFNIDWTNTAQSIVRGGRNTGAAFSGSLDYNLTLDLMKMDILPGAVVTFRGESRYGNSVNQDTGTLLPVNTDAFFPLTDDIDDNVAFNLTTLSLTQYFSDTFAVFAGKFDTLSGDPNEFASGRGTSQFLNSNFNLSPSLLITVPYSTLGGGLIVAPTRHITLSSAVYTTTDASDTSGFEHTDDGWTWANEMQVQYRIGDKPGGFNLGGTFAWDHEYKTVGRQFVFQPGQGFTPVGPEDESWAVYASVWQYLHVEQEPAPDTTLNLADGRPDLQGVGLFSRFSFADEDTNPVEFTFSAGLGGRGPFPGRDNDVWGAGYFYNSLQTRRLTAHLGEDDSAQGFEAFYEVAITPAVRATIDLQVFEPAIETIDTAVILGARLSMRF